jgi:uncharacterized phage-associated protein
MVDSVDFAKFVISRTAELNRTREDAIVLGETKLHKLLYICDGMMLAGDINLINERARAWNYGPVYPRVHSWLEKFPDAFSAMPPCSREAHGEIEQGDIPTLIDAVIASYGQWPAGKLSSWSHGPGSPWETALERGNGVMNSVIEKDDMKKYFKGLLGDAR